VVKKKKYLGEIAYGPTLKFGDRLARTREERHLTQQKLADLLEKSRTTIVQYEKGAIQPPLSVIELMASELGADPSFLAFGTGQGVKAEGQRFPVRRDQEGSANDYIECSDAVAEQLRLTARNGEVYVLADDAPHFGLARGDHVFVDAQRTELLGDGKLYAVRSSAGDLSLIRTPITFGDRVERLQITLGSGQESEVVATDVNVVGLVRATLRVE
jgi:transcriptional regulator with XRE-family HTH domain